MKALKTWVGRGARELLESVVSTLEHSFAVHSVAHGIAAELLRKQQLVLAARCVVLDTVAAAGLTRSWSRAGSGVTAEFADGRLRLWSCSVVRRAGGIQLFASSATLQQQLRNSNHGGEQQKLELRHI